MSAIAASPKGVLFAAGKDKGEQGVCGIYYAQPAQAPKKMSFATPDVDKDITALAVTANNLYWANVDGHIFKTGLTVTK